MSHARRQSGLWERNEDGFFQQSPLPSAKIAVSGAYLPESSPPSGPYSYYQPPQQQEKRRTFSDRTVEEQITPENMVTPSSRPPLTIDPDYTPPSNLRTQAWSPSPGGVVSPRTQQPQLQEKSRKDSNAGNKSGVTRRGSVPDRSPLQNLETWSKDEKRARAELAEGKLKSSIQRENKRVVSEGDEEISRNGSNGQERQRRVSGPPSLGYRKAVGSGEKPNQARPYDRGPDQQQAVRDSTDSADLGRSVSGKYKRRSRDAGYAGAADAAATAPTISNTYGGAADRGKAVYERRKSQVQSANNGNPISPPHSRENNTVQSGDQAMRRSGENGAYAGEVKSTLLPKEKLKTAKDVPVNYTLPPQTVAGQQASKQVGFDEDKHHRRLGGIFHREGHQHRSYQSSEKPSEDWRKAKTGKLTVDDLDLEGAVRAAQKPQKPNDAAAAAAWWEKDQRSRRVSSGSASKPSPRASIPQVDGPYEEQANGFKPRMFLKCGPLLRYTGMRREAARDGGEKETWRGSVMILTEDAHSDLSAAPVLRMFRQDMDLHKPPPRHLVEAGNVAPDDEDPVAGQVKLSRTGRALYVRPVHDIDGGVDLSREENNQGLYSATRTSVLGPQGNPVNSAARPHISFQDKSRIRARDGEKLGRYREVKATRLHSERGHTFWRFNLEVELASVQTRVAYRINKGPAVAFWVPARGETMNVMFHSCNGFSMSVDSNTFSGPDPLWRDVLNRHQAKPFHVMLGGGDQIYNDTVTRDTTLFRDWLQTKNPETKHHAEFTEEMQDELEEFYLERYAMWFSQGLFGMAAGQVPMVNIWDDHDIIDGFGSYPHHFQASRVFTGLGAIAHKYYLLFQHQSIASETEKDEPSWLLGQSPGPYINQVSRSVFLSLGKRMSLLGLDCRTERMRDEIFSQETYDIIFDRCRREIINGETKHLLVLLGVPIAYPRLNFLENMLTSRVMDPIKALGRTGMLGGFVNKFDGGVEILDDLDDHWTAKHHKAERNWFIQELQELAREKSVRVTILGGDVHLAAIGRFFSKPEVGLGRDRDWRYMPNVVSSAIVNTPPPVMLADVLNKRNKIHWLDEATGEDMIPIFKEDVDGTKRNNNCLLPRRNFCVLGEYVPGQTPPSSPGVGGDSGAGNGERENKKKFPPGSMKRTMSLTRGPINLVRRLSGSSKRRPSISRPSMDSQQNRPVFDGVQRANSLGSHPPDGYGFPPRQVPPPSMPQSRGGDEMQMERRPSYHRRPTDLTERDARKAAERIGVDGNLDGRAPGEISLEGGLDVCLCVERDQKNPIGETIGYRLLVPALWCEPGVKGEGEGELQRFSSHRKSLLERLKFNRKREERVSTVGGAEYNDEESDSDGEDDGAQARQHAERQHADDQTQPPQTQSRQQPAQYQLFPPTSTSAGQPPSRYAQPKPQTQQYFQQPNQQQQPILSTAQRSSRDNPSSAANSMGLSNTGRGAMTALPKRSTSGNAAVQSGSTPSVRSKTAPRVSMDGYARPNTTEFEDQDHAHAWSKGFAGGGPPIGGHNSSISSQQAGKNGEYPKSGYRRASGSQSQPQQWQEQEGDHHVLAQQANGRGGQETVGRKVSGGLPLSSVPRDGEEFEDFYSSFSEESGDEGVGTGMRRRGSERKADRFFGIGGRAKEEDGGSGKKKWMIWK